MKKITCSSIKYFLKQKNNKLILLVGLLLFFSLILTGFAVFKVRRAEMFFSRGMIQKGEDDKGIFSFIDFKKPKSKTVENVYCYVHLNGTDTGGCAKESPCQTIQYAVDSCSANNVDIYVAEGVYTGANSEVVLIKDKADTVLTIVGGYNPNNWDEAPDPDKFITTLDGQAQRRVFLIQNNKQVIIKNLHIIHGADKGGGIHAVNTPIILSNNKIKDNDYSGHRYGGGGYFSGSGSVTITDNIFLNNMGSEGGALYLGGKNNFILIKNNVFANNGSWEKGALTILNSENAKITISDNSFEDNIHSPNNQWGAVIQLINVGKNAEVLVNNNNMVNENYYDLSAMSISNSVVNIKNNVMSKFGGRDVIFSTNSDLNLVNNVFVDENGDYGIHFAGGDGISRNLTVKYTTFSNLKTPILINNENRFNPNVKIDNVIFADIKEGAAVYEHVKGGSVININGVLWHNTIKYDVREEDGTIITVANEIQADPQFLEDGYHIAVTSPAREAAVSGDVENDIDGDPRPWAPADIDGKSDFGADEYYYKFKYKCNAKGGICMGFRADRDSGIKSSCEIIIPNMDCPVGQICCCVSGDCLDVKINSEDPLPIKTY